jgi:hypothetical protein
VTRLGTILGAGATVGMFAVPTLLARVLTGRWQWPWEPPF